MESFIVPAVLVFELAVEGVKMTPCPLVLHDIKNTLVLQGLRITVTVGEISAQFL